MQFVFKYQHIIYCLKGNLTLIIISSYLKRQNGGLLGQINFVLQVLTYYQPSL